MGKRTHFAIHASSKPRTFKLKKASSGRASSSGPVNLKKAQSIK